MSDHAGDIANRIKRGYVGHPWNQAQGDRVTVSTPASNREAHIFAVFSSDGGVFRVTVEAVGYEGLTCEELDLDTYEPFEDDPLRPPPIEHGDLDIPTLRLLADGSFEPA